MSRFGTDYQIARATGRCAATDTVLEPGSTCVATLCDRPVESGQEGFERRDFSLEAWEAGHRPEGLFSYWKTTVPHPDAKPRLVIDETVLMELFERLASDERPQRIAFRFVLGLILMRKKHFKFVGREQVAGQEWWLLQPRGTGASAGGGTDSPPPPIRLANPQLSDDDVRSLIEQLSEILQSEL
jgi:hypothetical protein